MRVTLIDSPLANVASIHRALTAVDGEVARTADAAAVADAEKIVLPGVGSFDAAMSWLTACGLDVAIKQAVARGAALLGICVGHQLLFSRSEEGAPIPGLGLVDGDVVRFDGSLPVPQIGWNRVSSCGDTLFEGVDDGTPMYFVNSYAVRRSANTTAQAWYGSEFVAAVAKKRVYGVQFHPEKSSDAGLRILRNFVGLPS